MKKYITIFIIATLSACSSSQKSSTSKAAVVHVDTLKAASIDDLYLECRGIRDEMAKLDGLEAKGEVQDIRTLNERRLFLVNLYSTKVCK